MNDDQLGRRLNEAIPEPGADYWAKIHGRLADIEESNDFDAVDGSEDFSDTKPMVRRLTGMNNTNPPKSHASWSQGRPLLMAAAALVLIVGLGALAVTLRGNDDDVTELDVAAQTNDGAQPSTVPETGDAAPTTGVLPAPTTGAAASAVAGVTFGDAASPVGGTVKKITLSGPETGVMVACDAGGHQPFLFTDQGTWVGCQLPAGATAGGASAMAASVLAEVASPAGGTVGQLTIPGPETSVIVECGGDFVPFLYTDHGMWIGCQSPAPIGEPTPLPTPAPSGPDQDFVSGVMFGDAPSPVGGTVKKAILSGPETSVIVVCDQSGFEPFVFTDQGTWVGCKLTAGATAGAESTLTAAAYAEVASPVGGTVGQITIPGPQESVIIDCIGDFVPFLFTDQGTWIGCQSE